jgi:glycerophosphoryl diester phosphodiesterase
VSDRNGSAGRDSGAAVDRSILARSASSRSHVFNTGHRGASAYAPENTIAAYDLALMLGADSIELDLHMTADGELVIFHDEILGRTAGAGGLASGSILEKRWSDLRCLDAGTWFNELFPGYARPEYSDVRIPRLEDVFARYGSGITYFIEPKHPPSLCGLEERLLDVVDRCGISHSVGQRPVVVIESFSQKSLQRLRALEPSVQLVQLFREYATSAAMRSYLVAIPEYAVGIGPWAKTIDGALVRAAHEHELKVFTWTVNDPHEIETLLELGVDGIATDHPDRLDEALGRRPDPTPPHLRPAAA